MGNGPFIAMYGIPWMAQVRFVEYARLPVGDQLKETRRGPAGGY